MNIKIDRKNGVPIYIQVKNQIMNEVKNGNLKIREKMPTERELAEKIKISRNTVSSAYKLLEQEGVLISYQGKGTFVAEEAKTWKQHSIQDKLVKIIDLGLEETLEMGLTYKEFLALVHVRIKEREEFVKKLNAIFIECNIEQARYFSKELSDNTNLNVIPMTVSDLKVRNEHTEKLIRDANLIIATFNHVNEVKELIFDFKKEVFGVAINPNLETIVRIARYPSYTRFGFVCLSEEFLFKMENALKAAGIDKIELNATTSKVSEDVKNIVDSTDVIIVSPGRYKEVKSLVGDKKDVISFDYNLDEHSVKVIISKIIEMKKHNKVV